LNLKKKSELNNEILDSNKKFQNQSTICIFKLEKLEETRREAIEIIEIQ
jgi:hypothetical protein